MSDFSLTLVLQIMTSKIINDMAKVQQKSEKITAFGGIFFVLGSHGVCPPVRHHLFLVTCITIAVTHAHATQPEGRHLQIFA